MSTLLTRARFARQILPLQDAIFDAMGFRSTGTSKLTLFSRYGKAADNGKAIAQEVRHLSQTFFRMDLEVPEVPPCPAQFSNGSPAELHARMTSDLVSFAGELAAIWDCNRIGRIEPVADQAYRFTYYDFQRSGGVLTRSYDVVKHQHELVNARFHRLPASDVQKPKRANEMIRNLHYLRPYARVVTGLEVVRGSTHSESFTERTALGRTVDHAVSSARALGDAALTAGRSGAATAVAVGLGATGAVVGAGWLIANLSAAALADPALVIGDRVLFGWE